MRPAAARVWQAICISVAVVSFATGFVLGEYPFAAWLVLTLPLYPIVKLTGWGAIASVSLLAAVLGPLLVLLCARLGRSFGVSHRLARIAIGFLLLGSFHLGLTVGLFETWWVLHRCIDSETRIQHGLEEFHREHGKYPSTLDQFPRGVPDGGLLVRESILYYSVTEENYRLCHGDFLLQQCLTKDKSWHLWDPVD